MLVYIAPRRVLADFHFQLREKEPRREKHSDTNVDDDDVVPGEFVSPQQYSKESRMEAHLDRNR